jgi:hypothetical protein
MNNNPVYHPNRCTNGCKYTSVDPSRYICFHPRFIGGDGDGVGLLAEEKEFVKRMGCAAYESDKSKTLKAIVDEFIIENEITCGETVYQCDWVDENALPFIEALVKHEGYYDMETKKVVKKV